MSSDNDSSGGFGPWRRSSWSDRGGGRSVEVRFNAHAVHVRDGRVGAGPIIPVRAAHWPGFLAEVVGDVPPNSNRALRIEHVEAGDVRLHAFDSVAVLRFGRPEWDAFVEGVRAGEFDQLVPVPTIAGAATSQ